MLLAHTAHQVTGCQLTSTSSLLRSLVVIFAEKLSASARTWSPSLLKGPSTIEGLAFFLSILLHSLPKCSAQAVPDDYKPLPLTKSALPLTQAGV